MSLISLTGSIIKRGFGQNSSSRFCTEERNTYLLQPLRIAASSMYLPTRYVNARRCIAAATRSYAFDDIKLRAHYAGI